MDFRDYKLGYLLEVEDHVKLMSRAQPASQFAFGDVDPASLGEPMGAIDVLDVEDQQQISSCAGNAATTLVEEGLWLQGGIKGSKLSRMYAYVEGQRKCGIRGDNGATLEGVIEALKEGCPEERFMPYTGHYYTQVPDDARADAPKRKLLSYAGIDIQNPMNGLRQIYEGLAKKVGGVFIGIGCTDDIYNAPADGLMETYTPTRAGGHAMAFVDWCKEKDERGWPYLLLANSWGRRYGFRGYRKVRPSAVMSMMRSQYASFYLLSDMEFLKPRYDWNSQAWAA